MCFIFNVNVFPNDKKKIAETFLADTRLWLIAWRG